MLSRLRLTALIGLFLVLLSASSPAALPAAPPAPDADGDGICDAHEEALGTDPRTPEALQVVVDLGPSTDAARGRPGYDATKDFSKVEFCHVGGDRYLWRVTLAAPPRLDDTVLHLYVDADADAATGRKGPPQSTSTGTDYMLSVVADRGTSSLFSAEGRQQPGPAVRYAVAGNTLLMSADVNLARDAQGARFGLYVLCHTTTAAKQSPSMSKSSRKVVVTAPVSERPKIMRPADYLDNFRVESTYGEDLLRALLVAKDTLVVPHDKLHLQGFEVDLFTSHRWPHLKLTGREGQAWTEAPRAGRFHVGFMMYDDSNDERWASHQRQFCGLAAARQDNNRTWLYWLAEPSAFRGGERGELRTLGGRGKFGVINLVFLPRAPEVRKVAYAVEHLTSATHVGRPGWVTVSWITTWPCPTRFEYGRDAKYGKTLGSEAACLVHRVVLEGLDPAAEYHGRAVGTARDGSPFVSSDFVFRAASPAAPATPEGVKGVPLTVRNPHPFAVQQWPISTGIPFPQGALGSADCVRLLRGAEEVPAQVRLTARWPDGSVKWLLVTFLADAPAAKQADYRLEFGRGVRRGSPDAGMTVTEGPDGLRIDTGALRLRVDPRGNLTDLRQGSQPLVPENTACSTFAEDVHGAKYALGKGELHVEESGPIRAVVKSVAPLVDAKGVKLCTIEQHIEAYRGSPLLQVQHTLVVDGADKFTALRRLSYCVPTSASGGSWQAALAEGGALTLDASQPGLRQRFDGELVVESADRQTPQKGRLVGGLVGGGPQGCGVAVRDFWQNYPKAFRLASHAVEVDLCPRFEAGIYDKFPFEREGHHLYYYLLDGQYRFKQGTSKTHEMLLCFAPPAQRERLATVFQQPLLATASPECYCRSRAFYDVAPRNTSRFKLYEDAIDKNLKAYSAACERQHDYGMLNYGDWYGERGTNWGNEEYDTQHAFFLEYVRSGNPQAFYLGAATELHNRDVDTVHAAPDPGQLGAVYVHQMCHVGDYYDKAVPGSLGFAHGGFTVSHAWTEGHFDHYFLSGDRRSYATGCQVADYFVRHDLGRPYDFLTCRVPGWHLIMLASAYHATGDPYYLNAARIVVDRVLETQDKEPRPLPDYQAAGRKPYQVGGWSRMMVPGHCLCEPRHRGNAGFMVAVLLSGLKYYHDVTGDARVKECIIRGAHYLLEETYSDETHGFRYTSCPNMRYGSGASPLMVEGIARAYLWTKDDRFRRVLTEALPASARGSSYGKGFSMYYRMGPRVLADLEAAGLTLNEPPAK